MAQVSDPAYNLMLKTLLKHDVPEISVKDAALRYNAVFLDARQKAEFDTSHIRHAMYVGYDDFDSSKVKSIRKDDPVIVYCSVGYRSEKITEKLQQLGFTDIHNLYGGLFEWVNEGYKVYDDSGNETDKVHAYDYTWGIWLRKGDKVY
jgi:rhodanese-related sulfurtransferase